MTTIEDFKLHEETLQKWIGSCTKEEQLPICEAAMQNLLVAKFHDKINAIDLQLSVDTLRKQMDDKEGEIKYYQPSKSHFANNENNLQTTHY